MKPLTQIYQIRCHITLHNLTILSLINCPPAFPKLLCLDQNRMRRVRCDLTPSCRTRYVFVSNCLVIFCKICRCTPCHLTVTSYTKPLKPHLRNMKIGLLLDLNLACRGVQVSTQSDSKIAFKARTSKFHLEKLQKIIIFVSYLLINYIQSCQRN